MRNVIVATGTARGKKVKRFTRRQLHKAAVAARREAAAERKEAKGTDSYIDRSIRKTEAAFKGCELRV